MQFCCAWSLNFYTASRLSFSYCMAISCYTFVPPLPPRESSGVFFVDILSVSDKLDACSEIPAGPLMEDLYLIEILLSAVDK